MITMYRETLLSDIRSPEESPGSGTTINILLHRADAVAHLLAVDPSADTAWIPAEPTPEQEAAAEIARDVQMHAEWRKQWPHWYRAKFGDAAA